MSHILVTGGCGFIGKHLSLELSRGGHRVRILDTLSPQIHGDDPDLGWLDDAGIVLMRGSVCDPDACARAVDGVDAVVHLAAETGVGQSMYEIRRYMDVNVTGTATILEEVQRGEVERFVLSSSRAVYGEGTWRCTHCGPVHPTLRGFESGETRQWNPPCPVCGETVQTLLPTSESGTFDPVSVYGISKAGQERLTLLSGRSSGVACTALRFFNVFGPGQSLRNPYTGVLAVFVNRARGNKPIDVFEDGNILRDFVYIDDVVNAILRALETESPDPFNIGSGRAISILEIARQIVKELGAGSAITITGKGRVGDVRGIVGDTSLAHSCLGWTPSIGFEEGLSRFVSWAHGESYSDTYERSLRELETKGLYR